MYILPIEYFHFTFDFAIYTPYIIKNSDNDNLTCAN